jgi:hypothetical protein
MISIVHGPKQKIRSAHTTETTTTTFASAQTDTGIHLPAPFGVGLAGAWSGICISGMCRGVVSAFDSTVLAVITLLGSAPLGVLCRALGVV